MAQMERLSEKEKIEICKLRIRGFPEQRIVKMFYDDRENIPEDDRYHYTTFRKFWRSPEGEEYLRKAREEIHSGASKADYVHRSERLQTLIEAAGNLVNRFRLAVSDRDAIALSGEIRQLMKEIREESVPYDDQHVKDESPLEQFIRKVGTLSPKLQDMIAEDPN